MAKSYGQLVPSVERRLSTWVSLSERRGGKEPLETRPTITISRTFGCEAFPLSERLKELLEARTAEPWIIYDKALLERVSRDERLSMQLLEGLGGPSRAADTIGYLFPAHLHQDVVFRRVAKHILRVSELGNAIVVGRGGAIITQKLANCYHFRLDASVEFRVASMARRMEIPEREAQRLVQEHDKKREKLLEDCLHASVADPRYYDAIFNNARRSIGDIAECIVAYVAASWHDKSLFRSLAV